MMTRITLTDNNTYGLSVGSRTSQFSYLPALEANLQNTFGKRPAVLRDIYHRLWVRGEFSSWVEGFGLVEVIDKARSDAVYAELNKDIEL
jgi:hypothetical protein